MLDQWLGLALYGLIGLVSAAYVRWQVDRLERVRDDIKADLAEAIKAHRQIERQQAARATRVRRALYRMHASTGTPEENARRAAAALAEELDDTLNREGGK